MKTEPELTYALKDGKMVSIEDVERGLECGCVCPKCGQRLEARKGEIRQKHFAHLGEKAGNQPCHGYYMTALHRLAEQIIEDKKSVTFPAYKSKPRRIAHFHTVERELRNDLSNLQPDIVGIDSYGVRWMIEICNTHEVDSYKLNKIKTLNANCLEIDVSGQTLEGLETFLLNTDENRKWLNAPSYEQEIMRGRGARPKKGDKYIDWDLMQTEVSRFYQEQYFLSIKKNAPIPGYDDQNTCVTMYGLIKNGCKISYVKEDDAPSYKYYVMAVRFSEESFYFDDQYGCYDSEAEAQRKVYDGLS